LWSKSAQIRSLIGGTIMFLVLELYTLDFKLILILFYIYFNSGGLAHRDAEKVPGGPIVVIL